MNSSWYECWLSTLGIKEVVALCHGPRGTVLDTLFAREAYSYFENDLLFALLLWVQMYVDQSLSMDL